MDEVLTKSEQSTESNASRRNRESASQPNASDLRFYAEVFTWHPPEVVWAYFSDLTKWPEWSPICQGCKLMDSDRLAKGSVLEICFKLLGVNICVPSRIVDLKPPGLITWTGRKFGLRAIHTYSFTASDSGTLMSNEETLCSVPFPLSWLIKNWYRVTKLSSASLEGIQRELESGQ